MVSWIRKMPKTAESGEGRHVDAASGPAAGGTDGQPAPVRITIMDYNEGQFQEKAVATVEECFPFKDTASVIWINIDGVNDAWLIEKLCRQFDIHSLVIEDITNTQLRPKMEDFEQYLFIVVKMLYSPNNDDTIIAEQVSLILGNNFVISFQEQPSGDVFDPIRDRIRNAKGRIRKAGADYLAYSFIDAIVDNYFSLLEKLGERIEGMEEELMNNPHPGVIHDIHYFKRNIILLRKSVWPLREVVSNMERGESPLIKKTTKVFLRNVYDHTIQVIEAIETFRDMAAGMVDIYLSSVSNRMNEVMKVLTMIATIFIPLTFIAGIYGMNFNTHVSAWNMPELNWRYGYLFIWAVMLGVAGTMLFFFKRKKWI